MFSVPLQSLLLLLLRPLLVPLPLLLLLSLPVQMLLRLLVLSFTVLLLLLLPLLQLQLMPLLLLLLRHQLLQLAVYSCSGRRLILRPAVADDLMRCRLCCIPSHPFLILIRDRRVNPTG